MAFGVANRRLSVYLANTDLGPRGLGRRALEQIARGSYPVIPKPWPMEWGASSVYVIAAKGQLMLLDYKGTKEEQSSLKTFTEAADRLFNRIDGPPKQILEVQSTGVIEVPPKLTRDEWVRRYGTAEEPN